MTNPGKSKRKERPTRDVSRAEILASLHTLGVTANRHLIVHSSLSAIGRVEGGPQGFLSALREAIGSRAILAMPSFNKPLEPWLTLETPGNTGLITETLRLAPGTVRSLHPTHSVSLQGPQAERFAAGHEKARGGLDRDTPLHRLSDDGADVLLVGVNFRRCSLVHVAESVAELSYQCFPYPGYQLSTTVIRPDGTSLIYSPTQFPGDSNGFDAVEETLRKREKLTEGKIGEAYAMLTGAQDILDVSLALLKNDPAALLCSDDRCPVCPTRRSMASKKAE